MARIYLKSGNLDTRRLVRLYVFPERQYMDLPVRQRIVFILASQPQKALIAYERALQWEDLFDLAEREKLPKQEVQDIATRIAGELAILSCF